LGHEQTPPLQVVPPAHRTPQAPQFELSVVPFTHRLPQATCPAGQVHLPPVQV